MGRHSPRIIMVLGRHVRRPSPSMVVAVLSLVFATSGIAAAAIPDTSGQINGCYNNRNGTLRVIDTVPPASQTCTSKETPLVWSVAGPAGAPGPIGPAGPAGSVAATYVRSGDELDGRDIYCDPGDFATGGGAAGGHIDAIRGASVITASFGSDIPIGYRVAVTDDDFEVFVICVDATP